MSSTVYDTTSVLVDVIDEDGYDTGRAVFVVVSYSKETDSSHEADADGHRGVLAVSYEVLECVVEEQDRSDLTPAEEARVLADAKWIFHHSEKYHV